MTGNIKEWHKKNERKYNRKWSDVPRQEENGNSKRGRKKKTGVEKKRESNERGENTKTEMKDRIY